MSIYGTEFFLMFEHSDLRDQMMRIEHKYCNKYSFIPTQASEILSYFEKEHSTPDEEHEYILSLLESVINNLDHSLNSARSFYLTTAALCISNIGEMLEPIDSDDYENIDEYGEAKERRFFRWIKIVEQIYSNHTKEVPIAKRILKKAILLFFPLLCISILSLALTIFIHKIWIALPIAIILCLLLNAKLQNLFHASNYEHCEKICKSLGFSGLSPLFAKSIKKCDR